MVNKRASIWLCFTLLELLCLNHYRKNYISFGDDGPYNNNNKHKYAPPQALLLDDTKTPPHEKSRGAESLTFDGHQLEILSLYANNKLSSIHQDTATSYTKMPPKDELDWDAIDVPEPGYPKNTHLVDYGTYATETEIEKHDRLLVQGMQYMYSYLKSKEMDTGKKKISISNDNTNTKENSVDGNHSGNTNHKVCLNIYLCNRRIPYINSLLMTLTSYSNEQSKQDFLQTAQVHLLNTEKRPGRQDFPYLKNKLSKMPFVHEVHNITYPDEIYEHITDRELDFRETFISDEISGLKICLQSGLPYCLMIEEDAVVPVDFMTLLLKQVIEPLENKGVLNPSGGTGAISVVSLYSYYNLVFFGPHRLHYERYSKNKYQDDRAKMNIERWAWNMLPYKPKFQVKEKDYKYGTVAMLYTRESAMKLVEFMQSVGVDPIHNADEFMNADEYFPKVMGVKRKHVNPSLVNHIGFYSERMAHVKARGMFSQLNTDSRFIYDGGVL